MIVKDLQKYVKALTGDKITDILGSMSDPLLSFLVGNNANIEQYVGTITKFAKNTGTQIFYEFLQNADDAKASQAFFFFEENHFVVINNGLPFFTDTPDNKRKGQLFSFLGKEKNDKYGDADSIGKYGQGSKLLYDLLLPNQEGSDIAFKEESLIKTIVDETKGVILFSWDGLNQWEKFKNAEITDFQFNGEPSDDTKSILTKIIYTYYPATLGEQKQTLKGEKLLFSKGEMERCLSYISNLNSKLQHTQLNQGTLIYIPLGDGQAEKLAQLVDTSLLSGVKTSLAFLKNIKKVNIKDESVTNTKFEDVQLDEIKRGINIIQLAFHTLMPPSVLNKV